MAKTSPPGTPRAVAREKQTVAAMVRLYCAGHHAPDGLPCARCQALLAYAHDRLDECPFGGDKPACKACPVHCYQPARRDAMREVMRYAGPRMLLRHPWLAILHIWKERRRGTPLRPRKKAVSR